jgi:hypothetical protein
MTGMWITGGSSRIQAIILILLGMSASVALANPPRVIVQRVPQGGVQPQVAMGANGDVHLIYLTGDPSHSDVFYVRSSDGGKSWSEPIRVNTQPGSAMAIGTVRGAQIALGREGRVHVAWMGSTSAQPKGPGDATPMLYSRIASDGKSFEAQRNVIATHIGLDGGGSIAADEAGNVYVAWHAPTTPKSGEQDRRVWVARSTDDGKTFAPEVAISDAATGACGCCGMRVLSAGGRVFALYRGASKQVNRGMFLADADLNLANSHDREIAPMKIGMCVMSTSSLVPSTGGFLAAWETNSQVFWTDFGPNAFNADHAPHAVSVSGHGQKHPTIAANRDGWILVSWTQGTGWNNGGSVKWALFDPKGLQVPASNGGADDLPPWDAPIDFLRTDGSFVLLY